MKLSKNQQALYWRLWSKACRAQGWEHTNRELRLAAHQAALGEAKSMTEIDRTGDFGRVKNHFLYLAGDLRGAVESDHPEIDSGRRWRFIFNEQLAQLEALGLGEAYAEKVFLDRFGHADIMRLSAQAAPGRKSDLECLVMTLPARISQKRSELGWSVHHLCHLSATHCPAGCRQCASSEKATPK